MRKYQLGGRLQVRGWLLALLIAAGLSSAAANIYLGKHHVMRIENVAPYSCDAPPRPV